jgi:hypothetical protein
MFCCAYCVRGAEPHGAERSRLMCRAPFGTTQESLFPTAPVGLQYAARPFPSKAVPSTLVREEVRVILIDVIF